MLSRCGWQRRDEAGKDFHWFTLRFRDPGQEVGYLKKRHPRLITNFRACAGIVAAGFVVELLMFKVWDLSQERYDSYEQMRINQLCNFTFCFLFLFSGSVCLLLCMPCVVRSLRPAVLEAFSTFSVCSGMLIFGVATPHYAGMVFGYDTREHLAPRQLTDTFVVLGLDCLTTAAHILLPIRFQLMIFVQISGLLSYVLPALVLGAPHPENVPHTMVTYAILILLSAVGKHSLECEERIQFLALINEKRLRFESEYQLATYQEQKRKNSLEDVAASEPSTRGFKLDSTTGFTFEALVEVGLKEQWLISDKEVQLNTAKALGEGGFGVVVQGRYHGAPVAVKAPKKALANGKKNTFLEASCNELRILRRMRHPNIVVLYGAVLSEMTEGVQLCLVLELITGESLKQFMARSSEKEELALLSSEALRSKVLVDVASALLYLHSRQPVVVHGDLKNTNIFVEQHGGDRSTIHAKLLDFGLSRLVKRTASPMGGTLRWAAVEVLAGRQAPATATDMFSFGRLLFYVSTGRMPFSQVPDKQLRRHLLRSPAMDWPAGPPGDFQHHYRPLAEQCTRPRPELRPCMQDLYPVLASLERLARAAARSEANSEAPPTPPQGSELDAFEAFDFASDALLSTTMSSTSRQLAAVPEGQQLSTPSSSRASRSSRLAHSCYRQTPHDTLMKAVGYLLMQSNHKVGSNGSCCWIHSGLQRLKAVCRDMQGMQCDGWDVPVSGQCQDCLLLFVDGGEPTPTRVCSFCGGDVSAPGCSLTERTQSASDADAPADAPSKDAESSEFSSHVATSA